VIGRKSRAGFNDDCPGTAAAALRERQQCYLDAPDGPRAPHVVSGGRATLAGPVSTCIGGGFESQFIAAGTTL
jgi:hypothetical protein